MHVINLKMWGSSNNSEYIFIPVVDLRHQWNLPQQAFMTRCCLESQCLLA